MATTSRRQNAARYGSGLHLGGQGRLVEQHADSLQDGSATL
jgi:hypothetical protein